MSESNNQYSEEQKAQFTEFVAGRMFSNLQFNQVLATIEGQCRQQAKSVIETADNETLAKIEQDFLQSQAEGQIFGDVAVQQGSESIPGI